MIEDLDGQVTWEDLGIWYGKMSQEPSVPTKAKISKPSLKKRQGSQMKMPLFLDLRTASGHLPDASWEMDGVSLGEYMMHSSGVFLKDESGYVYSLTLTDRPQERYCLNCGEKPIPVLKTKLSQILESTPDAKYNLSAKACGGILRRAERRGKQLPPILKDALERQAQHTPSKLGGGREIDSLGKRAGKGALIQTELSATLGVSQDQTLVCLNDQGGSQMSVTEDMVSTLRAQEHGHQPLVVSQEGCDVFNGEITGETAVTVTASVGGVNTSGAKVISFGLDAYNQMADAELAQPLRAADGGDTTPKVVCLEGNGSRPSHRGDGYAESDSMYTLNSTEHHAVAYGIEPGAAKRLNTEGRILEEMTTTLRSEMGDNQLAVAYGISAYDSNSMKSKNPHSGIYEAETARTLDLNGGSPACNQGGMDICEPLPVENHPSDSRVKLCEDGIVQTLSSRMGTGGNNTPMVVSVDMGVGKSTCGIHQDLAPTLATTHYGEPAVCYPEAYCIGNGQVDQLYPKDIVGALNCMHDQQAVVNFTTEMTPKVDEDGTAFSLRSRDYKDPQGVAYGLDRASYNQGQNAKYGFSIDEELIGAQTAMGPGAVASRQGAVVRRLTPLECERLQGFPDGWTDIGDWVDSKGKTHKGDADSPRYKALGNSIALPFWQWLAYRIAPHIDHEPTMASLFDGIGGFPLVFNRAGCNPVWASEIEEFPIAVTKMWFKEVENDE